MTLPLVRGHKVTTSPLPMKPIAAERQDRTDSAKAASQVRHREPAGETV
jgi:two-component system sensor histidine kinase MtrB